MDEQRSTDRSRGFEQNAGSEQSAEFEQSIAPECNAQPELDALVHLDVPAHLDEPAHPDAPVHLDAPGEFSTSPEFSTPSDKSAFSHNAPLAKPSPASSFTLGRPAPSFTVGRSVLVLVTGLSAGFLSGLFGVGGGVLIVPALTLILGMDQKRAAATSLVAIIPTAAAGSVSYAMSGNVSLIAMLILIAGALVGAQIGVLLLHRLPERILPWIFVGFVAFVVISQRFHVPIRDSVFELDWYKGIVLLIVGLFSGILSGLVGVGGGSITVPGMEILVGAGDLLARGTSLLVIIPTAISGTITNSRHGVVDLKLGLILGAIAALAAPVGTFAAAQISPTLGELLFSCFLVFVGVQTLMKARKKPATKGE